MLVPDLTCACCNVFESGPRFAAGSAQPLHAKYGGQLEAIGYAPLAVDVIEEADTGNARALVYGHPLTWDRLEPLLDFEAQMRTFVSMAVRAEQRSPIR